MIILYIVYIIYIYSILYIGIYISYDDVPLQSNEPEVNEENETSKEPSVPASPVKTDKSVNQRRRNTINMPFVQKI